MNQDNPNFPGNTPQQGSPSQGSPHEGFPHEGFPQQGFPHPGYSQTPGTPQQGTPHQSLPHQGVQPQQQPQGGPGGYRPGQQQGGMPPAGGGPRPPQNAGGKGAKGQKSPKAKKPKKASNAGWVLLGIAIMLILIAVGGVMGYNSAISARQAQFDAQSVQVASQQYQLALVDIQNENFANAKTRLEYVLSVDPNYPGATEKYTEVVVSLYPKETPTPYYTPTPGPTATPDTRGEEEVFNTVVANMSSSDWETAIANMDVLRDRNLEYRALEVDGMYYIALRNWGINLIGQGYLESGIYRITLAEAFGPIDAMANNQRIAARAYLAGSGFWEIDWAKALEYYGNAYLNAPNMYDKASGYTAQQRYAEASFQYGSQLANNESYCDSLAYFDQGFLISANDAIAPTATAAYVLCYPPTATPEVIIPTVAPVVETQIIPDVPDVPTEVPLELPGTSQESPQP